MLTPSNYHETIEKFGIENLTPDFKKQHDNYLLIQDFYDDDEEIKQVIDLYFSKVEKFMNKQNKNAPERKQTRKSSKQASKESAPETEATLPSDDQHDEPPPPPRARKGKGNRQPKNANISHKEKAQRPAKLVEHIREEIKIIKRFVGLNKREKSPASIMTFLKSVQRAIIQKLVKKTSPLAKEIMFIQDKLISLVKRMKGDKEIGFEKDELERLVVIAGGEKVYPSIGIMKRYISLSGKQADDEKVSRFIKQIEKALHSEKIGEEDPYRHKVKSILKALKKVKTSSLVEIAEAELNGLSGIVSGCSCDSITQSTTGLSGVLTAEEMANRQVDLLSFTSVWQKLFGNPGRNFTLMVHGEPYNGKTIILLLLAKYLAETQGNVIYISSEEFGSDAMSEKVKKFVEPQPSRLHFAENLRDPRLSDYQFIIIDSVNELKLKIDEVRSLRKEYPKAAFIFVLQHTKAGDFRGGKDWEHVAEIVAEVKQGAVEVTKNRYAPKSTVDLFNYFNIEWEEPEPYHLANEINY
jgi:hypothetical protein